MDKSSDPEHGNILLPEESPENLLREAAETRDISVARRTVDSYLARVDERPELSFELSRALALESELIGEGIGMREGCMPFFLHHEGLTDAGAVLIHGFGSSPPEMRELGEFLHRGGITVYGVRLEGHGTNFEDFERSSADGWLDSVEAGWEIIRRASHRNFLIGVSLGGALALLLAAGKEPTGVVSLASPVWFRSRSIHFARLPFLKKLVRSVNIKVAREDEWFVSSRRPMAALSELLVIRDAMVRSLGEVTAPLMVVHAADDQTVKPSSARFIYDGAASKIRKFHWLKEGGHRLTLGGGPARNEIFGAILDFILSLTETDDAGRE